MEDISKILKKDKNVVNDTKMTEKIYKILDIELLKKLKEKESQGNNLPFTGENFIESGNINETLKYYNFKFSILDEQTYNFMNKAPDCILKDIKVKEYLINAGRIFVKIICIRN